MARKIAFIAMCSVTLSGCNSVDKAIKMFNDQIGHRIGFRIEPIASKPAGPTGATAASTVAPGPDNRAVNAAYLKELFKVVLHRDLRNQDEFDKFMNVMDQGGSYEGIYNGLVYSQEFKDKEKGVAAVGAVKAYAEIMAQLKLDQKYDSLKITEPETNDPLQANKDKLEPPQPSELERTSLIGDFEREALALSLFTLKRKLGEEIIRTIELKREYKEKFATWYGRFSVFMAKKGIDLGLPLRNRKDEYYHYKWALEADEDRLRWECLSRVHTLINAHAK